MYSGTPLDIKKMCSFSSYLIAIKFTCVIPGNVFVQAEGMLKLMKTVDPAPCPKNPIKKQTKLLH